MTTRLKYANRQCQNAASVAWSAGVGSPFVQFSDIALSLLYGSDIKNRCAYIVVLAFWHVVLKPVTYELVRFYKACAGLLGR